MPPHIGFKYSNTTICGGAVRLAPETNCAAKTVFFLLRISTDSRLPAASPLALPCGCVPDDFNGCSLPVWASAPVQYVHCILSQLRVLLKSNVNE